MTAVSLAATTIVSILAMVGASTVLVLIVDLPIRIARWRAWRCVRRQQRDRIARAVLLHRHGGRK